MLGSLFALFVLIPAAAVAAPVLSAQIAPEELHAALQECLTNPPPSANLPQDKIWVALKGFYQARDFQPVWVSDPQTDLALAALEQASANGLNPQRYHSAALLVHRQLATADDAAQYDIVLTDGLLRYARDMYLGRLDPVNVDRMVGIERAPFDPVASLAAALSGGTLKAWLASLPPPHAEYRRLKFALKRFREIVAQGGWPTVPVVRKIELEADNPELVALQARLAVEDPQIVAGTPIDIAMLESAVKRFQVRNGLKVDGVVGHATIAALNTSAVRTARPDQGEYGALALAATRFRPRYIAVNTAATTLEVVDKGKVVLTSRVIIRKKENAHADLYDEGRGDHRQPVMARALFDRAQRNIAQVAPQSRLSFPASYGDGRQPVSNSPAAGRRQCVGLYQAGDAQPFFDLSPRYGLASACLRRKNVTSVMDACAYRISFRWRPLF